MKRMLLVLVLTGLFASVKCFAGCAGNVTGIGPGTTTIANYIVNQNGNIGVTFGPLPGKTMTNTPTGNIAYLPATGCTTYSDQNCSNRLAQLSAVEQIWQLQVPVTAGWCVSNAAGLGYEIVNLGTGN